VEDIPLMFISIGLLECKVFVLFVIFCIIFHVVFCLLSVFNMSVV